MGAAERNMQTNGIQPEDSCPQGPYAFGVHAGTDPQYVGAGSIRNPCDQFHFWSLHSNGSNFLMADGAVRFLPYETPTALMIALATRAGGEPAGLAP